MPDHCTRCKTEIIPQSGHSHYYYRKGRDLLPQRMCTPCFLHVDKDPYFQSVDWEYVRNRKEADHA